MNDIDVWAELEQIRALVGRAELALADEHEAQTRAAVRELWQRAHVLWDLVSNW